MSRTIKQEDKKLPASCVSGLDGWALEARTWRGRILNYEFGGRFDGQSDKVVATVAEKRPDEAR